MRRLESKVAFITGSGSGIGRSAAQLFASEGAKVVVADIWPKGGEETVRLVKEAGGEALYVETDVTQPASVERAIKEAVGAYGKLNVLYNNAGGSTMNDGTVTEVSLDEWHRTINVDLYGTFLCCKYGIPELIKAGGGAVINTTSFAALVGIGHRTAYCAAKGGVVALTRAMAVEYAKYKIRVNVISPMVMLTERVKKFFAEDPRVRPEDIENMLLLGIGEPEDVAHAALFLASDEARLITGIILPVGK